MKNIKKSIGNRPRLATVLVVVVMIFIFVVGSAENLFKKKSPPVQKFYIVTSQQLQNNLYLSGIIAPISKTPILSPVKGGIEKQLVSFGSFVKKDTPVFVVRTTNGDAQYQALVTNFLKAQQALTKSKDDYKTETLLQQKGLIARDEYQAAKDQYNLNQLSYLQALSALKKILTASQLSALQKVSLNNIDAVKQLLDRLDSLEEVTVNAPTAGMLLFTKKEPAHDDTDADTSGVKEGDVLGYVGDTSGYSISLNVDEMHINTVQAGQKAVITTSAAPGVVLIGKVMSVSSQAGDSSGGASEPMFKVDVVVLDVSAEAQKVIHIGMDVKVSLEVAQAKAMIIPLIALHQESDSYFVYVKDSSGKLKKTNVEVGDTTPAGVEIIQGLKTGDQVLIGQ